MANEPTPDTGLLPRTYFRAPRVPLDLRALVIALLGFGVFRVGQWLLTKAFDGRDVVDAALAEFFRPWEIVFAFVGGVGHGGVAQGNVWHVLAGAAWIFLCYAYFGQAIHRITALRIARDEGLSLKAALAFGAKNFKTMLLCPVIVSLLIALLYGCNALAGLVSAIPFAGGLLALILVPLAMISSLLILLLAIGGALGLPLVGSAAAWERNGSLDAISRAFSYVFARPLQFVWNYFLIFLFTAILLAAGNYFADILQRSIGAGAAVSDAAEMAVEAAPLERHFDSVSDAEWKTKILWFAFWVFLNLVRYGITALALWWFLGASTSTYADLRADVDGTSEDEIYLEDEEEDFNALGQPPAPPPPAPPTPPPPATA